MALLEKKGVKPGESVLLQGSLVWSQIHEPIHGEALKKRIERQRQMGNQYPTMKPHYEIVLKDFKILDGTSQNIKEFIEEDSYTINRGDNKGQHRWGMTQNVNMNNIVPLNIWRPDQDGNLQKVELEGPIQNDQIVTVAIKTFATDFGNQGKMISDIILPVDFKYVGNSGGSDIIKNFGVQNLGSAFTQGNFNQMPQAPVQSQNTFNDGGFNEQPSSNNEFAQTPQEQPSFNKNQQNEYNGGFNTQQNASNDQQSFQAKQQPFNGGQQGFNQPQQQQAQPNTVSQQPFNGFNGGQQDFQQQQSYQQQQQQQSFNNGQQGYGGGSFGQQTPQQNPQFNNSPDNQPPQYGQHEDAFTDANPFS